MPSGAGSSPLAKCHNYATHLGRKVHFQADLSECCVIAPWLARIKQIDIGDRARSLAQQILIALQSMTVMLNVTLNTNKCMSYNKHYIPKQYYLMQESAASEAPLGSTTQAEDAAR